MDRRLREPSLTPLDTPPSQERDLHERETKLEREARVLKGLLLSVILFFLLGVGFSFYVFRTVQLKTPEIVAEMTQARTLDAEQRINNRFVEARTITIRFYEFLAIVLEFNPPVQSIRNHWASMTAQTTSLALDLGALSEEPIRASGRLYDTGPTRVQSILLSAKQITLEMQELIPRLLQAVRQAKGALEKEGGIMLIILGSLDELILPLIQEDSKMDREWTEIKNAIQKWVEHVAQDAAFVQKSVISETLTQEFSQRLRDEVF